MATGDRIERSGKRARRRVMVRYGLDRLDRTAFTQNLSPSGLCLRTNSVFKPGTTVQLQLTLGDESFSMWARVVWAKKVPPQLAHVLECGMGLCFIDPQTDWLAAFERWSRGKVGT